MDSDVKLIVIDAPTHNQSICRIAIPNALLLEWSKIRDWSSIIPRVNEHIVDEAIVLNPECTRLETNISKAVFRVANLVRKCTGRKKNKLIDESTLFTVFRGECISALELKKRADESESLYDYVMITDELIENLLIDVEDMEEELLWIHGLENKGRALDEIISTKQRKRKLEEVKRNAIEALSFVESYGLTADALTLHTVSGKSVRISLSDSIEHSDTREISQVLYLLDNYGVSDAFYQALTMHCDSLPRAHKIKEARYELNAQVELFRFPNYDGSYRNVETAVCDEITRLVSIILFI